MKLSFLSSLKDSFAVRLTGTTTALIFCTAFALNYFFYITQIKDIRSDILKHSASLANLLAHNCTIGVFTGDKEELSIQAKYILEEDDVLGVTVFDHDGAELLSVKKDTDLFDDSILPPFKDISKRIDDRESYFSTLESGLIVAAQSIRVFDRFDEEDLFIAEMENDGAAEQSRVIGHTVLLLSTALLEKRSKEILLRGIYFTLFISISAFILLTIAIKRLLLPLAQLTSEINRQQQGRNNRTIPRVAFIPFNFKEMINTIKKDFHTLNTLKIHLEDMVRTRTNDLDAANRDLKSQKKFLEETNDTLKKTIAELHSTQDKLVQSEKMAALGQLISGLSHEINNSINFVSSSLPLLKKNLSLSGEPDGIDNKLYAERKRLLNSMEEGVSRVTSIISDLRVYSHNKTDDFSIIDVQSILTGTLSLLKHEYLPRIDFHTDFVEALPHVKGNASQLNQVFMNILLNGVQAIDNKGLITVKTFIGQQKIHIQFSDTGCGIARENIHKIFEPFFTTKDVGKGTGLGLNIAYNIINAHGGSMEVETAEGKGTVFTISLPFASVK